MSTIPPRTKKSGKAPTRLRCATCNKLDEDFKVTCSLCRLNYHEGCLTDLGCVDEASAWVCGACSNSALYFNPATRSALTVRSPPAHLPNSVHSEDGDDASEMSDPPAAGINTQATSVITVMNSGSTSTSTALHAAALPASGATPLLQFDGALTPPAPAFLNSTNVSLLDEPVPPLGVESDSTATGEQFDPPRSPTLHARLDTLVGMVERLQAENRLQAEQAASERAAFARELENARRHNQKMETENLQTREALQHLQSEWNRKEAERAESLSRESQLAKFQAELANGTADEKGNETPRRKAFLERVRARGESRHQSPILPLNTTLPTTAIPLAESLAEIKGFLTALPALIREGMHSAVLPTVAQSVSAPARQQEDPFSASFRQHARTEASQEAATAETSASSRPNAAMERVAVTLARSYLTELPKFGGDPRDWPYFQSVFDQTTLDGAFKETDNVARLRKALVMPASGLVRHLLCKESATEIMDTLRRMYGRSQELIFTLIEELKANPEMKSESDPQLREFAVKVQSFVSTVKSLQCERELGCSYTVTALARKLHPTHYREWSKLRERDATLGMEGFANFLCDKVMEIRPDFLASSHVQGTATNPRAGGRVSTHRATAKTGSASNNNRGRIDWHFIPAFSPWMGGAWERLIGVTKKTLDFLATGETPRKDVLENALTEAELLMNRRPLTHLPIDHQDAMPLTPNTVLFGDDYDDSVYPAGVFSDSDAVSPRAHRRAQYLVGKYMSRWVKEYLPEINRRGKAYKDRRAAVQVGDAVIATEPNEPRNAWKKGIVTQVYPGPDGIVRVADIRLADGTIKPRRAVGRLAILDVKQGL